MKKRILTAALLLLALLLLGSAAWQSWGAKEEQRGPDEQQEMKPGLLPGQIRPPGEETVPESARGPALEPSPGQAGQPDAGGSGAQLMDFSGLQAQNPEIAGWIVIESLGIDYPIAKGADNSYYLDHTVKRQPNKLGALFMDYRNNPDFSDFHSVVYGHNMKSGKMFGRLAKMKEEATFNRVTEGTLYAPGKTYRLRIFAVVVTSAASDYYRYVFPDASSREEHLEMIRENALLYREVGAQAEDRLLALSTCSYEYKDARTVVIAKMEEDDLRD
ncbi:MAG: class B sortase [Christensenellaceae bacterium]|jgi:sortase B|nr:class B sortase [Christensenellaceae bacterium]